MVVILASMTLIIEFTQFSQVNRYVINLIMIDAK